MDLTELNTIKSLVKQNDIRPTRQSGQNFLICKDVLDKIIRTSEIYPQEKVLEIGPGFGTLTNRLLEAQASVTSVELDRNLAKFLSNNKLFKNLNLIRGDIIHEWLGLKKDFKNLDYKLIANLPYSLTSLIFRMFLSERPRPKKIVVLIQKEVAERIVAVPGKMSMLSIAVQFYGEPKIIDIVKPECFWPSPEVQSAILEVDNIGLDTKKYKKMLGNVKDEQFFKIAKIGFSAKRKQLHNNLANGLHKKSEEIKAFLTNLNINPAIRAQDLTIKQWIDISKNIQ
ncbi:MAG: 16S rRNA (adenine(1518)-N(6)/adenine(1519)-N(6))-dimethyltransferase RsmA [Candidatus Kerfeldbacteria bacterium]